MRDVIVIGTSAGGVETLAQVVRGLPAGFPASLFVVCHFPPGGRSVLPEILSRAGRLLATHAVDGEAFVPGQIYVAPPDQHLLLDPDGKLRLTRGARENHHRPAADPLFRSAARNYGSRVIGVVLSGAMSDGTAGLLAIRRSGGVTIAQSPEDALIPSMPQAASEVAGAVVTAKEMASLLISLVQDARPVERGTPAMDPIEKMPGAVNRDMDQQVHNDRRGELSVFTCPECGGSLWQVDETGIIRFRCHVGHAYNAETLVSEQSEALEAALWTAVRTFREKSVLSRQLAERERLSGNEGSAVRFDEQAAQSEEYGRLILVHILQADGPREASQAVA